MPIRNLYLSIYLTVVAVLLAFALVAGLLVSRPVTLTFRFHLTLAFADGRTQSFTAVAKPFTGAEESYNPEHSMPEMSISPSAAS